MSENNANRSEDQQQDRNKEQDQQGGGGKSNSLLEYFLYPYEGAVGFQLIKQHEAITRFLEQQVGRSYRASNGILIALSLPWRFPEWKESENIIYLDGTNGREIENPSKGFDATYFQTKFRDNGKVVRDAKMGMFKNALDEFVDLVKNTFSSELKYDRLKRNRQGMRVMLA